MICLQCGYCCQTSAVIVIKPEYIKEELDLNSLTEEMILFIENGTCPHYSIDENKQAHCKIHHYTWFKFTPCGTYNNEIQNDVECRMGRYQLNKTLM